MPESRRPEGPADRPEAPAHQHGPGAAGRRRQSPFGPGLIIAASFIGPGTITTSIVTGASYGFTLAWAVVFSIIATIILQEMTGRLGLATRLSLGEALRVVFESTIARAVMVVLVVAAIGIGGASYAGGDTTGTALALTTVTGLDVRIVVVAILLLIGLLLWTGSYKAIEVVLTIMVFVLGVIFLITAIVVRPPLGEMLRGMVVPTVPAGALLTTIALIGTTVVPYNLFLQSSLVQEKWGEDLDPDVSMRQSRTDTVLSISVGGLITLVVMATAFGAMFLRGMTAETGQDLTRALEPLLGPAAPWVFAVGLFAAGFTSAVAGPLGAAYAISGTIGRSTDLRSTPARVIWISVLLVGGVIALTGFNPVQIIIVAQAANGLLLPVIAIFLMIVMNNSRLMGRYRNGTVANVLGVLICLVVTGLAAYQLTDLFGVWD
ncbi:Nramp family divalent metal transporter [Kocuria aegyptia]|uniref:Nramp family divalent metal transporter n=1 Tax=Kocuria aegyptia TaxID=330943 RepID=A0ABN2KRQ1_9MICC